MTTVLELAKTCARRLKMPVPSTFVNNTSNNMVLLQTMMLKTIDDIKDEFEWPELNKTYTFKMVEGQDSYPIPFDYNFKINESLWNRSSHWPLIGPLNPQEWQVYESGIIATFPRQRFRVRGATNNQFFINPRPSADDNDKTCVYEYISRNAIRPATWVKNTAYTTANYVWADGNIFKCSSNGTSANRDSAFPAIGRDNTTHWESIPAFVASSIYYDGQFITGSGYVYLCTQTGHSSAVTPSHTSGSVTNGTCVFEYIATPATWAAGTLYTYDSTAVDNAYVINSANDVYRCTMTGYSGHYGPQFRVVITPTGTGQYPTVTTTTVTDGTATWTLYEQPYETFLADTDVVILDNGFIVDGTVWRYKAELGIEYDDLRKQAEEQKEIAKIKLMGAGPIMLARRGGYPFGIGLWAYPDANYGDS